MLQIFWSYFLVMTILHNPSLSESICSIESIDKGNVEVTTFDGTSYNIEKDVCLDYLMSCEMGLDEESEGFDAFAKSPNLPILPFAVKDNSIFFFSTTSNEKYEIQLATEGEETGEGDDYESIVKNYENWWFKIELEPKSGDMENNSNMECIGIIATELEVENNVEPLDSSFSDDYVVKISKCQWFDEKGKIHTFIEYDVSLKYKYHVCGLCGIWNSDVSDDLTYYDNNQCLLSGIDEESEETIEQLLNSILNPDPSIPQRRRLQDGDFFTCPESCDESYGYGVNCNFCNDNCQNCNNNICAQCKSGFFKKNDNTECMDCNEAFGDGCSFCQDYNGCGQCLDGYQRIYDAQCGLWYCLDNDMIVDDDTDGDDVSQFSIALDSMIKMYELDDSYYASYLDYAIEYSKLNEYPTDSTDNYSELKTRYLNFIDSNEQIIDLNENAINYFLENMNRTGTLIALNLTNTSGLYGNTQFSDWSLSEFSQLLGDIDTNTSENSNGTETLTTANGRRLQQLSGCWAISLVAPLAFLTSTFTSLTAYDPPIQNQNPCGTCVAFAVTGEMETNYNKQFGRTGNNVIKFSEQYMFDCSEYCSGNMVYNGDGANGCNLGSAITTEVAKFPDREGHCVNYAYNDGEYAQRFRPCDGCPEECKIYSNRVRFLTFDNFHYAQKFVSRFEKALLFRMNVAGGFKLNDKGYYFGDDCQSNDDVTGGHAMVVVGQKRVSRRVCFRWFGINICLWVRDDFLKIRNSWGTGWNAGGGGYFWIHEDAAKSSCFPEGFRYHTFPNNARQFPVPTSSLCDESPCDCNDNPYCRVCHGSAGCEQCHSGYFQRNRNYPCESCEEAFGGGCQVCNDYFGCSQCDVGYQHTYDACSKMWYCASVF